MQEKTREPEIRFAGFTGAWEQRKIGELSQIITGGTPNTSNSSYWEPGEIPWLSSGEVNKKRIFYADRKISRDGLTNSSAKWVTSRSVLIALAGQGKTRGTVAINEIPLTTNQSIAAISFSQQVDVDFIYQNLEKRYEEIRTLSSGDGSRGGLNKNIIANITTPYTSLEEQKKIGAFLSSIDSIITLHQRKYEKLLNIKKSMLEKMFPKEGEVVPEIRFKGFTGAWEQRKLREIATFINGRAYSQNELLSAGKYRVLRVGNFYTNDSWYYSNLELADKYYALNGDLLYTWSATFGPHIWTGNKVIYHYHIWKVELSESLEKYFAVQLLERDKNKILNDKNGSTMVHVTKSGMENEEVVIPFSVLEQQKIGNFFKKLDSLLTLHQRKLEMLKNVKQAFLEKMFV